MFLYVDQPTSYMRELELGRDCSNRGLTFFTRCLSNSRNWQLAVPKLLFFVLGGPIAAVATLLTGLSLHGAWWLIDVGTCTDNIEDVFQQEIHH